MRMTRSIAVAACWDTADRRMRAAGRKAWLREDLNAATREFDRLWPLCPHGCEPQNCFHCFSSVATSPFERNRKRA